MININDNLLISITIISWYTYYPRVFRRKKGDYVLPFAVCPASRQQFTRISSYTIDARMTKPICMIPLCVQMLTMYLKFFSQFWNNSDFSDFTPKCNFSVNFSRNWLNFFEVYGGKSYTTYIKRVLSCDLQITLENRNLDGGGQILKEICLLLQLPINSSDTVDARITKPLCELFMELFI